MKLRLHNTLDATSQLLQSALWPRAHESNANESVSGRAYREGVIEGRVWPLKLQRLIDRVFQLFGDRDHCRNAYETDLVRSEHYIERHKGYTR